MDNNIKNSFNEYCSTLWLNFDESTLISQNLYGEKEKGIAEKIEHIIKKENIIEFVEHNQISTNVLLLAGLTLTLNKFNFSDETLIFNQNNVPFAVKFENRQISIRSFLQKVHENWGEEVLKTEL